MSRMGCGVGKKKKNGGSGGEQHMEGRGGNVLPHLQFHLQCSVPSKKGRKEKVSKMVEPVSPSPSLQN